MTPDARREWADDWVVGELEGGRDLFAWSGREEVVDALASMDTDHLAWEAFRADTLASRHADWATAVREGLEGSGSTTMTLLRYRTMEEVRATGGNWYAGAGPEAGPSWPRQVTAKFAEVDGVLRIAEIAADS